MSVHELVAHVKAHARENYGRGWDSIVECWGDDDILKELREAGAATKADAIAAIAEFVTLYQQRKDDVLCQSGEHEKCARCGAWYWVGDDRGCGCQ